MSQELTREDIKNFVQQWDVKFIRLQFTDIFGAVKNVAIPVNQLNKALAGQIMFDGSSIEGFTRIEESDMYLKPDISTFKILPWQLEEGRIGRFICDICTPDREPFSGCPRTVLKKIVAEAGEKGFTMNVGPEPEFFIFHKDGEGKATTMTHEQAGYFDLAPVDLGEQVRRDIIIALEKMDFEVEAYHHEVAPGQHEIDFKYADALTTADRITTFKFIVKTIAAQHDLHATFMPKPVYGKSGSGMHLHQSLFKNDKNIFYATTTKFKLSKYALYYIGGILKHAPGFTAITNPLVNSYKRLVPGYEAPIYICWSERNRSPLIRVPAIRGENTRIEVRSPDPSCNPYLALAVLLKSGLDGIENKIEPPEPVNKNLYQMSDIARDKLNIGNIPSNLKNAVECFKRDGLLREALGEHISKHYIEAKQLEWSMYRKQITQWELNQYIEIF
ncbi:MAG: type I glutamate--ammonia ligase [Halanaerobiales bacterium]